MGNRREFGKRAKFAIIKRSMVAGLPTCEWVESGVRCVCTKGLQVHHDKMDAMEVDKSKKLTIDDGRNLCIPHHEPITKQQTAVLNKSKRIEAKHMGVKTLSTIQSRGFLKKTARRVPQLPMPPRRFV